MVISQTGDENLATQDLSQDRYLQGNDMEIYKHRTIMMKLITDGVNIDAHGVLSGNSFLNY
ncbi:MAG: hypothetical protein U5K71_05695 [Gracilimonas sp.]|nr:hypothetical protein [Gracilimonas sp.]